MVGTPCKRSAFLQVSSSPGLYSKKLAPQYGMDPRDPDKQRIGQPEVPFMRIFFVLSAARFEEFQGHEENKHPSPG